jgi:pimeloyl-ACP methyl ester carboxylesterase
MAVRSETLAVLPATGSDLGFFSWAREMRALAACVARPPCFPSGDLPRGRGETVLVLPGILAGDWTTVRLRSFLTQQGYRVAGSDIAFNAGPTRGIITQIERKLLSLSDKASGPILLVGQSLGGIFARGLAHRHPERVRGVVTLCSPIRFPVTTPLEPFVRALAILHDAGWVADRERIAAAPPAPVTAIYSREDGIVDWRQCLQDEGPGYPNVHVAGAHTTMGSNPEAQRVIAQKLAATR